MRTALALFYAICLVGNSSASSTEDKKQRDTVDEPNKDDSSSGEAYGIDVSFPIHRRISTNYPWLPHNVDPEHNDVPKKFKGMPIQPLGDRQSMYNEHLAGCRDYYDEDDSRQCDIYEYDRMLMNIRQPQSMQNYTAEGFKKIRAPAKVLELATSFWEKNQYSQEPEAWPVGNTYINNWVSPTYMLRVEDAKLRGGGGNLRNTIWDAARETLEDWTGEDLSPTSMYGIRIYKEGAVLLPHVDRLPLVASAMVNIAQDVEEEWPMEIYDHEGRAHNVTMEPGDMLLFESHSIIHGRPFPLKGKYYAMLYFHFEPTGHSLRHGHSNDVETADDVKEQYKQSAKDNVGGQSASADTLPPYLIRESPEEIHWRQLHPKGWEVPEFNPLKRSSSSKLHRAAAAGDVKAVEAALDKKGGKKAEKVMNKRDDEGWQLIHEGAAGGHKEVVELLVSHGADLNVRTHGGHGGTPLYIAEKNNGGWHPIVRYLKNHGALNVGPDNDAHSEL